MSAHVSEELPRLLTGEAPRDVVLDAARHLRSCIDCQQELVSAVVSHASLSSAHRFAPEVVADPAREESTESADPLPDLSAIFAQAREEADSPLRRVRHLRPSGSHRVRLLAGAAAAVVVLGGGAAAIVATTGNDGPTGRTVQLSAFDRGTTTGSATLSGNRVVIDAASLQQLDGKGYEVWLTDPQRASMKPVGWIGSDGKATLNIPAGLIKKYSDIEVSVQDVDSPSYEYSGASVLRGAYVDA